MGLSFKVFVWENIERFKDAEPLELFGGVRVCVCVCGCVSIKLKNCHSCKKKLVIAAGCLEMGVGRMGIMARELSWDGNHR